MLRYLALAVAGEARAAVRREAIAVAFFAVGAIVLVIAVVFAALAARDWLEFAAALTPTQANLAVAGALIVVAVILVVIGVYKRQRPIERTPLAAGAILGGPGCRGGAWPAVQRRDPLRGGRNRRRRLSRSPRWARGLERMPREYFSAGGGKPNPIPRVS